MWQPMQRLEEPKESVSIEKLSSQRRWRFTFHVRGFARIGRFLQLLGGLLETLTLPGAMSLPVLEAGELSLNVAVSVQVSSLDSHSRLPLENVGIRLGLGLGILEIV